MTRGVGLRKLTKPYSTPDLALEIICNVAPFMAFGMFTRIMEVLILLVRYVEQVSLDPCVCVCVCECVRVCLCVAGWRDCWKWLCRYKLTVC